MTTERRVAVICLGLGELHQLLAGTAQLKLWFSGTPIDVNSLEITACSYSAEADGIAIAVNVNAEVYGLGFYSGGDCLRLRLGHELVPVEIQSEVRKEQGDER